MSINEIEKIARNYFYAGETARKHTYNLWQDRYNRLRYTVDIAGARDALRVLQALNQVDAA